MDEELKMTFTLTSPDGSTDVTEVRRNGAITKDCVWQISDQMYQALFGAAKEKPDD
tara:strand:- start:386 stop:553 length:168 start_codon:yes stop_codon:yes gene_type:complete